MLIRVQIEWQASKQKEALPSAHVHAQQQEKPPEGIFKTRFLFCHILWLWLWRIGGNDNFRIYILTLFPLLFDICVNSQTIPILLAKNIWKAIK